MPTTIQITPMSDTFRPSTPTSSSMHPTALGRSVGAVPDPIEHVAIRRPEWPDWAALGLDSLSDDAHQFREASARGEFSRARSASDLGAKQRVLCGRTLNSIRRPDAWGLHDLVPLVDVICFHCHDMVKPCSWYIRRSRTTTAAQETDLAGKVRLLAVRVKRPLSSVDARMRWSCDAFKFAQERLPRLGSRVRIPSSAPTNLLVRGHFRGPSIASGGGDEAVKPH
jgi:hypothetical protein